MVNQAGEFNDGILKLVFDRRLMLQFVAPWSPPIRIVDVSRTRRRTRLDRDGG